MILYKNRSEKLPSNKTVEFNKGYIVVRGDGTKDDQIGKLIKDFCHYLSYENMLQRLFFK